MYIGKTLFAQLMDFLPWKTFHRLIDRHDGDRYVKSMTCADQFRVLAFAQLTYRESLRDIEVSLTAQAAKLYHMGFRQEIKRLTLADANESRDWRIHAEFAQCLIAQARKLYIGDSFGIELENTAYALDSTTIDLCLSLFPWALFRTTKSAVKMHTLLDLRGNIPSFIHISDGKLGDVKVLDILVLEPGAFYIMDRGYSGLRAPLRDASGPSLLCYPRQVEHPVSAYLFGAGRSQHGHHLRSDHCADRRDQPERLSDSFAAHPIQGPRDRQDFVFLTNNFVVTATTICALYKARWQVELFFKWIKQHLRIKKFYGNSENAVKSQIWIAISVYVLVAIVKKRLNLDASLYTLLQILSVTLFEKMPLQQAFPDGDCKAINEPLCNQLNLFDF